MVVVIKKHIKKFSAHAFGARIIFFNALHAKFTIFHKNLLFETYTDMHTMIIKIYNHTNMYMS